MKIINGPKWLNVANMMRSVKVAPLTVSDNMIADNYLLALLMTACKPGDFLIYLDASIEQQLFADLNIGPKYNGLKEQFLCTDLQEGIDRMITTYEVAAAKKMQAEEKAKEEQAEMASYKEKYEESIESIAKLTEGLKLANSELTKTQEQVVKYDDLLTEKSSTIDELRTALQSAADKIESMRDEFNGVCKKFGLSKDTDGKWTQDLMKVIEYTELKKDYDGLNTEFKRHKESWNLMHDDLMGICSDFGIYKDDEGKWQMIKDEKYQGMTNTASEVPIEDANKLSAEEFTELDNEEIEVIEDSNVSESKED